MNEPTIEELEEYDEENNIDCDACGNTGMKFEGDVHVGDCPECCGGTL